MRGRGTPVVVGLPQSAASGVPPIKNAGIAPGSNVQLITLNTEGLLDLSISYLCGNEIIKKVSEPLQSL